MSTKTQVGSIDLAPIKSAHDAAAQVATSYVTETGNGIKVHPEGDTHNYVEITDDIDIWRQNAHGDDVVVASFGEEVVVGAVNGNNVLISSDGVAVRDGSTDLASFGVSGVTVGTGDTGSISVRQNGIYGYGSDDVKYFEIKRTSDVAPIKKYYHGYEGEINTVGTESFSATDLASRVQNNLILELGFGDLISTGSDSFYSYDYTTRNITYGTPTTEVFTYSVGNTVSVTYDGAYAFVITSTFDTEIDVGVYYYISQVAPTYIFGNLYNDASLVPGVFSMNEGKSIAPGKYSHSEGFETIASGNYSHAAGRQSEASGQDSFVEGYDNTASGVSSHAEGVSTEASGYMSHAGNYGTIAQGWAQTAIGSFNVASGSNYPSSAVPEPIFIIGNGSDDNNRSNAFVVSTDGNIQVAIDINALAGTTDHDLYAAIAALNWEGDVIS